MTSLIVAQIIGNELPPRDLSGERLETLKFLLKRYPPPIENTIFILNRIQNSSFLIEVEAIIRAAGYEIHSIPYEAKIDIFPHKDPCPLQYARAVIGINEARNFAIKLGLSRANVVCPLDQDCIMDMVAFKKISNKIRHHEQTKKYSYYSLSMRRAFHENDSWNMYDRKEEPQLIFTNRSKTFFNENLGFSEDDKRSLLRKIGYSRSDDYILKSDLCIELGRVIHGSIYKNEADSKLERRVKLRRDSLIKYGSDRLKEDFKCVR